MTTTKQKLTLDQPTTYQIKVPGIQEYRWSDWNRNINVQIENDQEGLLRRPGFLQGILRRLYSLGIPLISVDCFDFS